MISSSRKKANKMSLRYLFDCIYIFEFLTLETLSRSP